MFRERKPDGTKSAGKMLLRKREKISGTIGARKKI
jgi:hypothetical protein